MAIPQSQLEVWEKQGSITQSAATYATVKSALESPRAHYQSRDFDVFLQGSYGNDCNIYAESDVDVVIRYNGAFFHDLNGLSPEQQSAFQAHFSDGGYPYKTFKGNVQGALEDAFGEAVKEGKRAIKVAADGNRRNADVIVAFEFRRYFQFGGEYNQRFEKGICFFAQDGTRISNYPKQHSDNSTAKHKATNGNFKRAVRIFKNMRSKLVEDGVLTKGAAPSYFLEGLLYNVPDRVFVGTTSQMILGILQWLHQTTDRSGFICVNEQFYLLRDNAPECWPCADGDRFIAAAVKLWDNW